MSGPRFDEIEGEEETGPRFEDIEGDEVVTTAATPPAVAPNGPVLRAPAPSTWNTLRSVAEATGTVPAGLIPDEGTARGAVASILQGPTLNWADETAGLVRSADASYLYKPKERAKVNAQIDERVRSYVAGGMDPEAAKDRATGDVLGLGGTRYREGREDFRNVEGAFRKENPAAAFALTTGAGMMSGGPLQRAGGLSRYLPAIGEGMIAGAGAADEQRDVPLATFAGGALGYAGGWLGERLGNAVEAGVNRAGQSQLVTGIVEPSPAAQYLEQQGVNNLTIAQMAPGTRLAQLEEAASFAGGSGPGIRAMRQAGQEEWQRAAANAARPPGMGLIPKGTPPTAAQHAMDAGFDAAYSIAHGHPIDQRTALAAAQAVNDPTVYASAETRQQVGDFVRDQISALTPRQDGALDSGEVIRLRSELRQQMRNMPDDARQEQALFRLVVNFLSTVLDTELPPHAAATLRDADRQYAQYMTLGDAVIASKDSIQGFTPAHLGTAVARNTPRQLYKQGGGGPLRALAAAGRETLESRSHPTGAIAMVTGSNPVVPWVNGFAMQTLNQPGPRAALLGRTALQQSIQQNAPITGEVLGDGIGRLGPAAAYAQRNEAEAPERKDTASSDLIQDAVANNPEALGPYAQQLQQAAADGNLPIVHYALQQKDPQYRRMLDQFRGGAR